MSKSATQSYLRFPLDFILGNIGNVRVLRALSLYGGPLGVTQLAREAGMTPQGIRLVLDSLISSGVVEVLGQGRTQLYVQKSEHPWAEPLKALFQAEQGQWTTLLASLRERLQANDQVTGAWLYGSVARGQDKPRSDVDLAVLLKPDADDAGLRDTLEALEQERHVPLSVVYLTEDDLASGATDPQWWNKVLSEGQQLKGRPRTAVAP